MNLFAHPQTLWLLLILGAPLGAFMFWSWRTKQKLITQFVQSRLLANLTVGVSQTRQKLRLILLVGAVLFLVLAMARPQWGFSWEEAKQQGLDIVVAIDTSRSMLADDLAPNRLTRAKLAALDLMKLAKSDRLGLVAFAGSAFLQCPLTLDEEAFRQSVESLDVGVIPQGGTALTAAIQSTLTAFEKENDNHKVLVLFTDGEDQESDAVAAAEKAAKNGLKIFTIGVGTSEGELIRVPGEDGNNGFLKDDDGNVVKSRLNETLLQKIATAANGFYLPLRGAKPMETLYAKGLAPLPKSDSTTKLVRQYHERYHWPLGIAILLLILETLLPQRKRIARATASGISARPAIAGTVILLLTLATFSSNASPSSALREYESGNFHTALDEFKKLSEQKTNDLRLSYNAGTAAYRAKQFDDAEKFLSRATTSPDLKLQQEAYYNLGNTLFQAGEQVAEPDKKQESWESSAQNFENSLKLNPQDADAKNNLQMVKKKLEELKKQQQQQQKQQSKNNQSKDKEKQDKNEQQKNQEKNKQDQKNDSQSEQKDSEQKNDPSQQQQDSAKKEKEEQEKKSQQAKDDQKKQDQQKNQQQQDGKEGEKQQEAMAMAAGQMTPEQARQFLDAQKQEDKALIFAPPKDPKQTNRKLKDW